MNELPIELLQDVFAHLCVQCGLCNENESLHTVASCMQVCKRWNQILKHKFAGNPLFDRFNTRLYVLDSNNRVVSGDEYVANVLVQTNADGFIKTLSRRQTLHVSFDYIYMTPGDRERMIAWERQRYLMETQ
jgi:hypothetical protein